MKIIHAVLGLVLISSACANEISGPAPDVSDETSGETAATEPSFVCNEQLDSWVTLRGEGFSPLVIDSLDDDVTTTAENPQVTLTLVSSVDGDAAEGEYEVTLENVNEIDVRWIDQEEMQFLIRPQLEILPGRYDVTVTNSNGEATTQEAVFGVLPRPTVENLEPAFVCLAQGARGMIVEGSDFLVDGDALPTVMVGDKSYEPTEAADCREPGGPFGNYQLCGSLTIELADSDFEPSVQDVSVTNIDPAACSSLPEEDGSALRVVPPPTITQITEELACLEEGERSFVVTGTDIISHDGGSPTVTIGGNTYDATTSDCETVDVFNGSFENCTSASFTVPQDDLEPNAYEVTVNNPSPADCSSSEPVQLTIVPPPSVADIEPEVVCSEQIDNTLTITGTGFITYDGTAPTVNVAGTDFDSTASDCTAISTVVNATAQTCSTLTVEVPADTLAAGELDVTVTNPMPAGCSSVEPVTIAFVPPPSVTAVVEDFTCVETRTDTVRIEGTGFLDVDGTLPSVTIGGVAVTTLDVDECMAVAGATNVQTCDVVNVEVAEGAIDVGDNPVIVTNAAPAQCVSEEMVFLEAYAAPTVATVEPTLFCDDAGDTTVTVTGTNFYTVDSAQPTVEIGGQSYAATVNTATCTATTRTGVEVCTELTATVTQGSLTTGDSAVSVVNPEPIACPSSTDGNVLVGGGPNITNTLPMAICGGDTFDGVVTLQGDTFLRIDSSEPTVLVEGNPVAVDAMSGCTAVQHPNLTIENCTELTLTVPVALRATDVNIEVTNPAPADCGSSTTQLTLEPTPSITAITPLRVCDAGGSIQIDGANFEQGMEVTLGTTAATTVTVNTDGTSATADFGALTEGTYDLTLRNPNSGCQTTHTEQVRVVTGPRAFFADPPVVYDGISTQVTIYLTGLYGGSVASVEIVDSNGNTTALTNVTFDPNRPNTVQAVVPAGVLPANTTFDDFDIVLTDDVMCSEQTADLLSVTNELTVSVDSIDPPFGWTHDSTGVTVTSEDPTPANFVPFASTPRVYLNPDQVQMGDIATELRSVQFLSEFELNGIVPSGLPAGTYDIIVVNPDGTVGLLDAAFDVTADPPPVINSVSPGSWETGVSALAIDFEGESFRMPTIEVTCTAPDGTVTTLAPTVVTNTDTTIDATVDTSTLTNLSVCEARVTNTNDGTFADFAPITVTNPAGNFVSFGPGPDMLTARRAPALLSGEPSSSARYLYAIGGDDGTSANTLDSIEVSPLNRLGDPGAWMNSNSTLPAGRTLSAATRIGSFIYLVGGHDGTTAMGDVSRAMVLDPLDTTAISNVEFDIDPNMAGGVTPGTYYYRVAPVLSGADAANPGGEQLASEIQPVRVPFAGIDVNLTWTPYPNAAEYRIYRSPDPDLTAGSEELLATVNGAMTTFIDDGTATTDAAVTPLPLGSLGQWHSVATLSTARHSHGVASATDPADSSIHYIYAAGGIDTADGRLDSLEKITVTVNGPRDQVVDDTDTSVTATMTVARSELAVLVGTPQVASNLTGTHLYVMGGRADGGGGFSRATEVGDVTAGGDIATLVGTTNLQRTRAGYASAIANNNIVAACGQGGAPSSTADKMSISSTTAPLIDGSSSLGDVGTLRPRYLPGYTSFTGILYVAGGQSDLNAASTTIDYSTLGGTP